MMNDEWWKQRVVYQIYPRSFMDSDGDGIGDLNGIRMKVPYLKYLGIGVLWLSPIYKSPNEDNGYDISDYHSILEDFGTMEDFDLLLKEAHENDIKVILDLVVNHTSDEHVWFRKSCSKDPGKYRDYYLWREGRDGEPPNRWESYFGGSAWEYNQEVGKYYLHLFSKKQPDLNWENPELRQEIYRMMRWWIEKGIDGFRMDVINFISKHEDFPDGENIPGSSFTRKERFTVCGPRLHEYLREMNREVLGQYDIMTVGETPFITVGEAQKITDRENDELNMIFQFEHMDIENESGSKWTAKKFDLVKLKSVFSKWQNGLNPRGWNSLYWCNHDQPRVVSRFGNDSRYWQESAKLLALCLHLQKGTPFIYQGEEIGMTNIALSNIEEYRDIETINAFWYQTEIMGVSEQDMMRCIHARSRDNARTPMQWNDKDHGGFTNGTPWFASNRNYRKINIESQRNDQTSILNFYRRLIALRAEFEIIVSGDFHIISLNSPHLFIFERLLGDKRLRVIANVSDQTNIYFSDDLLTHSHHPRLLISNYPSGPLMSNMILRPYEARAYLFEGK
jgi:oligo-1,6-glucosidase